MDNHACKTCRSPLTLIAGVQLSKFVRYMAAVAALLALAACASSPKPDKLIATVTPGLTKTELINRLGPPDGEYEYMGQNCFQYALGDTNVPLAVYFDAQARVAGTVRAACKGRVR